LHVVLVVHARLLLRLALSRLRRLLVLPDEPQQPLPDHQQRRCRHAVRFEALDCLR
jgi:hypothetical protein